MILIYIKISLYPFTVMLTPVLPMSHQTRGNLEDRSGKPKTYHRYLRLHTVCLKVLKIIMDIVISRLLELKFRWVSLLLP